MPEYHRTFIEQTFRHDYPRLLYCKLLDIDCIGYTMKEICSKTGEKEFRARKFIRSHLIKNNLVTVEKKGLISYYTVVPVERAIDSLATKLTEGARGEIARLENENERLKVQMGEMREREMESIKHMMEYVLFQNPNQDQVYRTIVRLGGSAREKRLLNTINRDRESDRERAAPESAEPALAQMTQQEFDEAVAALERENLIHIGENRRQKEYSSLFPAAYFSAYYRELVGEIKELDERKNELERTTGELDQRSGELDQREAELNQRHAGLQGEMDDLKRLSELEETIRGLREKNSEQEAAIKGYLEEIGDLEADVSRYMAEAKSRELEIERLRQEPPAAALEGGNAAKFPYAEAPARPGTQLNPQLEELLNAFLDQQIGEDPASKDIRAVYRLLFISGQTMDRNQIAERFKEQGAEIFDFKIGFYLDALVDSGLASRHDTGYKAAAVRDVSDSRDKENKKRISEMQSELDRVRGLLTEAVDRGSLSESELKQERAKLAGQSGRIIELEKRVETLDKLLQPQSIGLSDIEREYVHGLGLDKEETAVYLAMFETPNMLYSAADISDQTSIHESRVWHILRGTLSRRGFARSEEDLWEPVHPSHFIAEEWKGYKEGRIQAEMASADLKAMLAKVDAARSTLNEINDEIASAGAVLEETDKKIERARQTAERIDRVIDSLADEKHGLENRLFELRQIDIENNPTFVEALEHHYNQLKEQIAANKRPRNQE